MPGKWCLCHDDVDFDDILPLWFRCRGYAAFFHQFYQHYARRFTAPKKFQLKLLSTEKLLMWLSYKKAAQKLLTKLRSFTFDCSQISKDVRSCLSTWVVTTSSLRTTTTTYGIRRCTETHFFDPLLFDRYCHFGNYYRCIFSLKNNNKCPLHFICGFGPWK